jgi:hypothetical protein|tara:strand:- start:204 stop:695 length:492 start_codon:yes stop_codon:yes gene_type:complete
MAADRATVSVSASLLPDNIKTSVGGTTTYDINDNGSANKWIFVRMQTDSTTARDLVTEDGVQYLNETITYTDTIPLTVEATDDVVFIVIKNTATTDGSTASTANLYVGMSGGDLSVNSGTIVIGPNEVWFAKLRGEALADINAASSSGDLTYDVWALLEDGGF